MPRLNGSAESGSGVTDMPLVVDDLLEMSQAQLDDLFRKAEVGPIPDGDGDGTAIVAPGTPIGGIAARLARFLAWQGKVVDAAKGELRNKVGPFGLLAIKAKVYRAPAWFDGREAIILDYSSTSLVAHRIRDEIRLIAPGTYLGQVFWGRTRIVNFALVFPRMRARAMQQERGAASAQTTAAGPTP